MGQTGLNQYTAIADFSLYGNWVIIVHVSQGKENLPIKNIFYVEEGERT
jgi:hypothetical protein